MTKYRVLLFALLLGLSCTTFAQVYKSIDAEGNVTFSDSPAGGGEVYRIPEINVADPVEVPEYVPPAPKPKVVVEEKSQPQTVIINNDVVNRNNRHNPRRPGTSPGTPIIKPELPSTNPPSIKPKPSHF